MTTRKRPGYSVTMTTRRRPVSADFTLICFQIIYFDFGLKVIIKVTSWDVISQASHWLVKNISQNKKVGVVCDDWQVAFQNKGQFEKH